MNTISVIVPIYNAELYLARCIESLIHQSYTALQIILVNDGSTDKSLAIAETLTEQDSRIELYSFAKNQGQSAARNFGIKQATGQFISFVDADDFLDHDYYQQLANNIGTYDCIQCGYRRVSESGNILVDNQPKHFYQFTAPWSRLYKTNFILQHQLSFPIGMIYEDVLFSIDLWTTKPNYKIVPYIGYNYTDNKNSTTATRNIIAERRLFAALRQKLSTAPTLKQTLITLYTIIRLKFHFLRHDK